MDFAMCSPFLEADVWEKRLRVAAQCTVEINEYNNIQTLMPILQIKQFSLLVIMFNGLAGIDAVRQIRLQQPETPLLWISDEDFSIFGYQYRVTQFLQKPVCDTDLQEAVKNCLNIFK